MFRAYLPKALALTVLTAGLTVAGAQQPQTDQPSTQGDAPAHRHHGPNPQKQAERLSLKLNLTPDQTAKIEPILADRDQKIQALRANQQLTEQNRHQQMNAINEQSQQQMAGVLTADQMSQLKAMRRGEHGRHGHGGQDNQPSNSSQSPS